MHDSVAQNVLLDPRDYAFESPVIKARKRTVSVAQDDDSSDNKFDEKEERRLAKNAREAARRQRLKEKVAQMSTPPKAKKLSVSKNISIPPVHSGLRSPTPPLDHTRETVGSGFKFTECERTYTMNYVQVLLARDHEIPAHTIAAALHNKVDDSSSVINS